MNCGSTNTYTFRSGHNTDLIDHKTDLLSGSGYHLVSHEDVKEAPLDAVNPCRYDANLGYDDSDGSSQTSSQDSVGDLSQGTIPSSPFSNASDDRNADPHCDSDSQGEWSSLSHPKTSSNGNNHNNVIQSNVEHCQSSFHPVQLAKNLCTQQPGFANVPFRLKEARNARISQDSTPVPAPTQQLHHQNPLPVPNTQLSQSNRRRGCSIGAAPCPPKLRRDTDNTDAIVKMIVIFCTNLIASIWSSSSAYESSAASHSGSNVLPLQIFITETLRRSKTSYSTLQIALYYLILLKQCLPKLKSPRDSSQPGCRAMQCGRRMFLTALILASKYLQDRNYSARAWSKISGLPLKEINDNERSYLGIVGWDLHVPKETFENWSKIVLAICRLSTEQDLTGKGFDYQPPSPGMPPVYPRQCQLQSMCRDLNALRSWWTSNLRGLCTDIVRCHQKTEQYLLSISPFRDTPAPSRPIFDNLPRAESPDSFADKDNDASSRCLPRIPSLDRINQSFQPIDRVDSPAATLPMPPPPMLRNLPTPQTTPRSDMTNIWTPKAFKPSLRCRASASTLSYLDRNCHPMANLEMCPPPAPRFNATTKPRAWGIGNMSASSQAPDRSITSSPESVVSDTWSFAARSRSSSISSTSSFLTVSSYSTGSMSDNEQCERLQQDYASLQQRLGDSHRSPQQPCPTIAAQDRVDRPRTAFKVSDTRSDYFNDPASISEAGATGFTDEGYASSDSDLKRKEKEAAQGLMAIKSMERMESMSGRIGLQRCNTTIYNPRQQETTKQHILKRSRSESLEHAHESFAALYKYGLDDKFCSGAELWNQNMAKCVTEPYQSYAMPRKPVPCGAQNKRLAVQTPSLAADLAASQLRNEVSAS